MSTDDPWQGPPDDATYAKLRAHDRALAEARRQRRGAEVSRMIQTGGTDQLADLIVTLEERIQRLEGESYARTLGP